MSNPLKLASKLYAMVGSGELDNLGPVFELLSSTLYNYPARGHLAGARRTGGDSSSPFPTREQLEQFLAADERIRLALAQLVAIVAELPIWQDVIADLEAKGMSASAAADIAEDTRGGFDSWLADLRAFVAFVPEYSKEMAQTASEGATLALHAAGVSPIPPRAGSGREPSTAAPPAAGSKCTCGRPASGELFGFPICSTCQEGAREMLERLQ